MYCPQKPHLTQKRPNLKKSRVGTTKLIYFTQGQTKFLRSSPLKYFNFPKLSHRSYKLLKYGWFKQTKNAKTSLLAIIWSLKLCLQSMCGAKYAWLSSMCEQSLHCSHPCAEQICRFCSAQDREQCRPYSTHGREPCRFCSTHGAET